MKKWMDEDAVLTVDVGTGWMSRFEFESLSAGTVVRSATEAGTGCAIRLNGDFFAQGSVAVFDGSAGAFFCAFLDSLEEPAKRNPEPRRGDLATGLLPFAVRLATVRVPMRALEGTGVSTIVNLDRALSPERDAELVIAGQTVASGKVVVIGENMGLRINELCVELPRGSFPRMTGSALSSGYAAEPVKDYNFRMPDRFTKRAIMRTHDIHLDFLRSLQARLPELSGWKLEFIDQLNYGEWLDDIGGRNASFVSFRPASRARAYEREESARLPDTPLIEASGATFKIDDATLAIVREWVRSRHEPKDEIPYQLALSGAARSLAGDPDFGITLASLRNGWLDTADLRIGEAAGADPATVSGAPSLRNDRDRSFMILIARFTRPDGSKMDIVYPENLIEPYLPALGR
jgi:flagellar motor switch/type III secretory pathway protein FliN